MKRARKTPSPLVVRSVTGAELEVRREQRLRTVELLRQQRTPLQVIAVATDAVSRAGEAMARALVEQPPMRPLACREGCAWCCQKVVGTTVPEVMRIAQALHETLEPGERAALLDRLVQHDVERRSQDSWTAARLPCPLLVNQRCSVYPLRPLTCRGFHSSDARQCERHAKERGAPPGPVHGAQQRAATLILDGMRSGLSECRLSNDLLELTAALRIALTIPAAAERWLNGEPVFAPARLA